MRVELSLYVSVNDLDYFFDNYHALSKLNKLGYINVNNNDKKYYISSFIVKKLTFSYKVIDFNKLIFEDFKTIYCAYKECDWYFLGFDLYVPLQPLREFSSIAGLYDYTSDIKLPWEIYAGLDRTDKSRIINNSIRTTYEDNFTITYDNKPNYPEFGRESLTYKIVCEKIDQVLNVDNFYKVKYD